MPSISLNLKFILLFVAMFLLSNCTKAIETTGRPANQTTTPFTLPTEAYLAMSKNQLGEEKQSLLIMAAGRSIYDGQWQEAAHILAQTTELSVAQMNEKRILLAKIAFLTDQPVAAINKLAKVHDTSHLSAFYQTQYHEILASSYEATGNGSYSVAERIKLEHLLPNEATRSMNRQALWDTLSKIPTAEINTLAVEAKEGSDFQGWMALAVILKEKTKDEQALASEVNQWQHRFPSHPANQFLLKRTAANKSDLSSSPQKMALLLPLSGPLAGPGGAVRDGFMAAYNASKVNHDVSVNLYDTASGQADLLYQQAIAEGADYVVGPLTKNDVAKIATIEHPVPTLLLNDIETVSQNAYRFGLSPIEEARQVAARAYKSGFKKTLIIAPAGAWGDEIVTAFNLQWQNNGGEVVDRLSYDNSTNLSNELRLLLHVSQQDANQKQEKSNSGKEIKSYPKRREDFDMIFLLAYPSKARQIMPLLKYYFAGDVPVFATSSVYAGSTNTIRDRDLDGIVFCDMPWIFTNQLGNRSWPEQWNSYSRLYALGMDSYALATQLNQLASSPTEGISNKSGVLYLNPSQQITRVLAWGKFKGGVAKQTNDVI